MLIRFIKYSIPSYITCILLLFTLSCLLFSNSSYSQFYSGSYQQFGKNRVQYFNKFWSFYRFERFDTYFYTGGKQLAIFTSKYADKCIKNIEKKLDYEMTTKIQFIIFNKLSDLKQSNIGYNSGETYNTGGLTHLIGSKIVLYFDGNHIDFERQIRRGIANIILNEMMYGTKVTAMIKNSALMNMPDWYYKGLISFLAEEWNTELDNQVRDGILSGYYKKFYNLSGYDAINAGHSMWKYIADKYGPASVSNIIYMNKISRNIESGFMFVLGISFKNFLTEWYSYYELQYASFNNVSKKNENQLLLKKFKNNTTYQQFKISPDGKYATYVSNIYGRYKVWIYNFETNKSKCIFRKEPKLDDKIDLSYPLLAWHPSSQILSMIFESKGKILMYFYTLEDKTFDKQRLFNVEKVLDYSYSQNGKWLALSAVNLGQSDIYVYNLASHTLDQITKDIYDDMYPHFINNSKDIVFSSNRNNDTIKFSTPDDMNSISSPLPTIPEYFDIYLYDYSKHGKTLRRVTSTPESHEIYPMPYSNKYFTFLCDENGIYNRYLARLDSAISYIDTSTHYRNFTTSYPITNYNRSILFQDISDKSDKISEIMLDNGKYIMQYEEKLPVKDLNELKLPLTYYCKQIEDAKIIKKADSLNKVKEEIENIKKKKNKAKKISNVLINEVTPPIDTSKIDINNYQFGSEQLANKKEDSATRSKNLFLLPREENYNVEFSINQLATQIDFSYLNINYQKYVGGGAPIFLNPGFNLSFQIGAIDLLEDYRITGGVKFAVDFDNFEYLLCLENNKKRLDKTITFYRQDLKTQNEYSQIKVHSNSLFYTLKWPFSNVLCIKGTFTARYDNTVFLSTDVQNLREPNLEEIWGGIKGELIFDNTRDRGLNLYYGTRWKIFGEYYQRAESQMNNLIVLGLDYRRYTKIYKTFIWANRLAGSTSFGSSPLLYYLGGVDSWIVPKYNYDINVSQRKNYGYQTLATNMRGFAQNIRNGNNFVVINSELRFPIFKILSKKPIRSEFISNFQFIGFGDVGMCWTGWDPTSDENTLFKEVIQQGPIKVTIINERDPVVGGIGLGARTKFLGYFIRADYAWGIENVEFQPGIFYISLGLDF